MRNIILDLAVTLDGFIEGPNGEIDWCIMDDDMGFHDFLQSIDTIFYGRVSYDAWGRYQPPAIATPVEKDLWAAVHGKKKYVFSRQPRTDPDAIYIGGDIKDRVEDIRKQGGRDIWLYGGAGLITTFMSLGLVDVYRLAVHPVVLGGGKPLFENVQKRLDLTLVETRTFRSGVVQLVYKPA